MADSTRSTRPSQSVRSGSGQLDAEVLQDDLVHALARELERHLVDRVDVARRHHRAHRQVREQGDLLADVLAEVLLGPAHDHVRLDADAAQLLHRVLRGLRLQLAGVAEERHEREVDEHAAVAPDLRVELAQRLEERQRLDVAHRAADLGDDDVHVARLGDELDPVLDLVGDVRDHLDGAAEVVAAALAPDHRVVDRAGGGVGGAARVGVREALVVAQVEVGLRAVLGDEHLAVLERAHRARVDVDVRVELLDRDGQTASDQEPAERGRGDALPKCGDDAAGDEYEAGFRAALWHQVSGKSSVLKAPADDSRGRKELLGVTAGGRVRGLGSEHPAQLGDDAVALERLDRGERGVGLGRLLDAEVRSWRARRSEGGA